LDIEINHLRQLSAEEIAAPAPTNTNAGQLHYKYMPRTSEWGTADVEYACLTPAENSNRVVKEQWVGDGIVQFQHARWEDMPTQYNIVNTFYALEIKEYRGASVVKSVGGKDLSDQRILR
jgi:hypothetical protein